MQGLTGSDSISQKPLHSRSVVDYENQFSLQVELVECADMKTGVVNHDIPSPSLKQNRQGLRNLRIWHIE